ncbi:lipid kinase [Altericista sp. CCNU0014]|uniref:lipid kinase n=1 Tax=Altericista sp. CCNU0014 TaxID=3082949 RepID=UPI00384F33B1
MGKRALLLINRHARKGQQKISTVIELLRERGFDLLEREMPPSGELSNLIRQHKDRVDLVIVGGGDGTLNAAIAGLIDTQLPLGLLPLGTANDLARTLGIQADLAQACQVIAAGNTRRIDIGWVNGQHFFNVASLGLSVKITRELTKEVKQRWGILAYAVTAFKVLWKSRPFWAEVREANGQVHSVKTIQITVGNGRFYGGGMVVASNATINDGRLDLYSLSLQHWWQMIALMPLFQRGHHASTPWSESWEGQEFYVQTRRPRSINTDGEITTSTPAHFRILPKALTVFTPAQSAGDSTPPQNTSAGLSPKH